MSDKALGLYKGQGATPVAGTWVTLFTTNPTVDAPTSNGAVEWGPARVRVFTDSGAGSPSWSAISDLSPTVRQISNVGSIQWSSLVLTVSPSTIVGVGVYDAATSGNLLTWQPIPEDEQFSREDGESVVLKTGAVKITAE
jgi:hypothetical protein